jgi:oxygen-independent coproporphyrinogen-3 oxidase
VSEADVGVYVHVPFCDRVCPYCDFAVVGGGVSEALEDRYVAALEAEIAMRADTFRGRHLTSLYLGGGTPSLLRAASIERIAERVLERFPADPSRGFELTLEVNPSTVERARLPDFRAAGVNRVSVGVQSFDDETLQRLGRAHRVKEVHETLAATRAAGFENVSVDLMFAAPGQSLAMLGNDLAEVARFGPEHVSTYELVVEPGTPFALADERGQLERADSDEAADMLESIERVLAGVGIAQYELTNYARPGFESVHNRRYWQRAPVLGVGLGAWSSEPETPEAPYGRRSRNTRALGEYLARLEQRTTPCDESEVHDAATARSEAVFLALRTREGLVAARFEGWFDDPPRTFFAEEIDRLISSGLVEEQRSGDLRLTQRGRMLSDLVGQCFVC